MRKMIAVFLLISMLFVSGCDSNQSKTKKIELGSMNLASCKVTGDQLIKDSTDFDEYISKDIDFNYVYIQNDESNYIASLAIEDDLSKKKLSDGLEFNKEDLTLTQSKNLNLDRTRENFPTTGIKEIDELIQNGIIDKLFVTYQYQDTRCLLGLSITIKDDKITDTTVEEIKNKLKDSENFSLTDRGLDAKGTYVYKDTKEMISVSSIENQKVIFDYIILIN